MTDKEILLRKNIIPQALAVGYFAHKGMGCFAWQEQEWVIQLPIPASEDTCFWEGPFASVYQVEHGPGRLHSVSKLVSDM